MSRASRARGCWGRGLGLAAISGLRATLGPAFLARGAKKRIGLRRFAYALVLGELVGDKLPGTPSRTRPLGLAARAFSGALVTARARPGRARRTGVAGSFAGTLAGALAGAVTAIAAAFIGVRARVALTRLLGGGALASAFAGGVEDASAIAIADAIS